MSMRKFECTAEIPEGWEPTGEFRPARGCEWTIDGANSIVRGPANYPSIIVRQVYVPPSWLMPGTWIYPYEGQWYASTQDPLRVRDGEYSIRCGGLSVARQLNGNIFCFVPPPELRPYQVPPKESP